MSRRSPATPRALDHPSKGVTSLALVHSPRLHQGRRSPAHPVRRKAAVCSPSAGSCLQPCCAPCPRWPLPHLQAGSSSPGWAPRRGRAFSPMWGKVSHQPAPHPTKTYLLTAGPRAPVLPRHRWPVTLSSSRGNSRYSILIAGDQRDQQAALSLAARLPEGDLQTNCCRDD